MLRMLIMSTFASLAVILAAGSAYAQSETEIIRLHDACRAGDRDACAHFGQAIHDHDHESEWRRSHPDWYR
jgi:hypothetical protein